MIDSSAMRKIKEIIITLITHVPGRSASPNKYLIGVARIRIIIKALIKAVMMMYLFFNNSLEKIKELE